MEVLEKLNQEMGEDRAANGGSLGPHAGVWEISTRWTTRLAGDRALDTVMVMEDMRPKD